MPEKIASCLICCTEWEVNESRHNTHLYCRPCRTKRERQIDYGHSEPCIPWAGDFDDNDNPIRFGQLYLPGERKCNHRDCVQKAHIIKPVTTQDLIAEQFSLYHRTGKRLDYEDLMRQLNKEKSQSSLVA